MGQSVPLSLLYHLHLHCLQVFVNGQHFCDYDHRVDLRSVSHIYVDGDAKFTDIGFTAFFVSKRMLYREQIVLKGLWMN